MRGGDGYVCRIIDSAGWVMLESLSAVKELLLALTEMRVALHI